MVTVSTDATRLDIDTVHRWLSTDAYWAIGRARDVVERASSPTTRPWLCDVYVDPDTRGSGVGTALMAAVDVALTELKVRRAVLATADAHGLYAKFGFEPLSQPERWMLRTYLP